ncbi:MAG: NADPH:quinone oxidoreductase family protein [Halopseudomonas sp.]
MKAIICKQFGPIDQLTYEETQEPAVSTNSAKIRITACGVNFPDALLVQGLYQAKPPLPFIPGCEFAGVVDAVGDQVTHLKPGDRVLASSLQLGGFAEKAVIDSSQLFLLPDDISDQQAAALPCAFGTAHHALKQRAQLQSGETLLVLGASGATGLAAVQIGKAMGATVIAACSSDEKLKLAKSHGADHLINYNNQNLAKSVKELTDRKGADVIFDPIGGDAFDSCTHCIAWNGRLLVIGFASGRIPTLEANLALVKGFSVVGVFWGAFTQHQPSTYQANMDELFGWLQSGDVTPYIDDLLPLSQAPQAMQQIINRTVKGKLILTPDA